MDSTLRRTKSRLTADEFSVAGSDVVDGEDDFEDEVASNPDGDANEEVLYEFEAPADGPGAEVVPRHRGPLPFVDSNIFQLVIGSVILSNVVVMILEAKYPEEQRWWAIENIFLPIYVFELLSRVVHYGCLFFYHPSDMAWNWIDLLIVWSGIFEFWIIPVVAEHGSQNEWVIWVLWASRHFRVIRLLRLVKLIRVVVQADFSWTEGPCFQSTVGIVIFFNSIIIGVETDFKWDGWWWIEQALLLFFSFELVCRLKNSGLYRFYFGGDDLAWNHLDTFIVLGGIGDQWLLPVIELIAGNSSQHVIGKVMMLVRMMRLFRIMRLLRLVKIVQPLYNLAMGIVEALQGMFWVLVIMTMFIYVVAIVFTRMIGQTLIFAPGELSPETRDQFATVAESMFTLFEITTGWSLMEIYPLLEKYQILKPFFVVYTVFSSWALLSVMTGVVSENMVIIRETQELDNEQREKEQRKAPLKALREMFQEIDADNSGYVTREEFDKLLGNRDLMRKLRKLGAVHVSSLKQIFDFIDFDGDGDIKPEEFIAGFKWVTEPFSGRHILKLERHIKGMLRNITLAASEVISKDILNDVTARLTEVAVASTDTADQAAREASECVHKLARYHAKTHLELESRLGELERSSAQRWQRVAEDWKALDGCVGKALMAIERMKQDVIKARDHFVRDPRKGFHLGLRSK
mmetsp:Transcript_37315/g.81515  ORF Transcript_37315/g.81515 Transcript_37315/m.81515 type:complete len:688 (+) Transcript_37315:105-2168(+)